MSRYVPGEQITSQVPHYHRNEASELHKAMVAFKPKIGEDATTVKFKHWQYAISNLALMHFGAGWEEKSYVTQSIMLALPSAFTHALSKPWTDQSMSCPELFRNLSWDDVLE